MRRQIQMKRVARSAGSTRTTPRLTAVGSKLNTFFNMAGYNPKGAEPPGIPGRDEGYLYWLTWFLHNGASVFSVDDAQGAVWRGALMVSCSSLAGFEEASQLLATVTALPVCPDDPTAKGGTR